MVSLIQQSNRGFFTLIVNKISHGKIIADLSEASQVLDEI